MLTAGKVIDIATKAAEDIFATFSQDRCGVVSLIAHNREVLRYFSGTGEVWVFFQVPGEEEPRCVAVKAGPFNAFRVRRMVRLSTVPDRATAKNSRYAKRVTKLRFKEDSWLNGASIARNKNDEVRK